jgi:penicillin-binding protein 1A
LQEMLKGVVANGTGRAAGLRIPAYGKTGTSQDNRDALFIGYAGDLVVGVWIGNDDNTPLKGINGGGLPARLWRDFMVQAVKGAAPAPRPKPIKLPDPEGPIEPLDLPEIPLPDFPVNIEGTDVRINRDRGVTVSTEVGGVPLDVSLGKDGFDIKTRNDDSIQRR